MDLDFQSFLFSLFLRTSPDAESDAPLSFWPPLAKGRRGTSNYCLNNLDNDCNYLPNNHNDSHIYRSLALLRRSYDRTECCWGNTNIWHCLIFPTVRILKEGKSQLEGLVAESLFLQVFKFNCQKIDVHEYKLLEVYSSMWC